MPDVTQMTDAELEAAITAISERITALEDERYAIEGGAETAAGDAHPRESALYR